MNKKRVHVVLPQVEGWSHLVEKHLPLMTKKKKKSIMMECLTGAADNSDI